MSINELIASIPLFEGLPEDQINELAFIAEDHSLAKGEMIFSEGEEGRGFYVVISGRIKIFKLSFEGKEQILHILGPGEPFGEVPVFAGQKFPAHSQTLDKSRVFYFSREELLNLIKGHPDIALNMLSVLSKRLRQFTNMIDDLSLKEVPGRLASHLLYLSDLQKDSSNVALTITKSQLASLLGTIPETLSRILGKMTGQGIIESRGNKIKIIDKEALISLADSEVRL
jgi:CRP/FNR family transcriptional regulator